MLAIGRRFILGAAALALIGLAGCNASGGSGAVSADDMALGAEDAPVTLIEYASSTCPHCATFHAEVFEQLKTNYIDTGRVRYVFREYPTAPAPVAVAGFQLARCGGATPEQYFTRLGELFRQQQAIFATGTMEGVRGKFIEIGAAAGLSEEQVMACITDEAGAERIRRIVETGNREFAITGTPTFVINGQKVEDPSMVTYEGMARALDAAAAN
ncbi:MAG: DsbA family protein [Phycisphaerales bacterium]|nr:DsbA family protein [Hyphomonadaceae bacterium]